MDEERQQGESMPVNNGLSSKEIIFYAERYSPTGPCADGFNERPVSSARLKLSRSRRLPG